MSLAEQVLFQELPDFFDDFIGRFFSEKQRSYFRRLVTEIFLVWKNLFSDVVKFVSFLLVSVFLSFAMPCPLCNLFPWNFFIKIFRQKQKGTTVQKEFHVWACLLWACFYFFCFNFFVYCFLLCFSSKFSGKTKRKYKEWMLVLEKSFY